MIVVAVSMIMDQSIATSNSVVVAVIIGTQSLGSSRTLKIIKHLQIVFDALVTVLR